MAKRTLSGVGRTPSPLGTLIIAPADVPPMIRIRAGSVAFGYAGCNPAGQTVTK